MKRITLVLGSIVASLLLMGAGLVTVQAASTPPSAAKAAALKNTDTNPLPKHIQPELLQAYAGALGMTTDSLSQTLNAKNTLYSIAKSKGLTKKAFRKKVADQLQAMINKGTIKGEMASYYQHTIQWANSNGNQ
jgi:aminopeptidase N